MRLVGGEGAGGEKVGETALGFYGEEYGIKLRSASPVDTGPSLICVGVCQAPARYNNCGVRLSDARPRLGVWTSSEVCWPAGTARRYRKVDGGWCVRTVAYWKGVFSVIHLGSIW